LNFEGLTPKFSFCAYAKKELKELIQKNIIKKIGKGKNTYYVLVTEPKEWVKKMDIYSKRKRSRNQV